MFIYICTAVATGLDAVDEIGDSANVDEDGMFGGIGDVEPASVAADSIPSEPFSGL